MPFVLLRFSSYSLKIVVVSFTGADNILTVLVYRLRYTTAATTFTAHYILFHILLNLHRAVIVSQ